VAEQAVERLDDLVVGDRDEEGADDQGQQDRQHRVTNRRQPGPQVAALRLHLGLGNDRLGCG
jgi:hypothetical protein